VTGRPQDIRMQTVVAGYGDSLLPATAIGMVKNSTDGAQSAGTVEPRSELTAFYDEQHSVFRELYEATRPLLRTQAATEPDTGAGGLR
jgi:xylulokinase